MKNQLYENIMAGISKSLKNILNENTNTYDSVDVCKIALGDYYDLTDEESLEYIEYDNKHTFTYNNENWAVFDSYDSAREFAIKYNVNTFEDGNVFEYINFDILGGIEQFVNVKWFEEFVEEECQMQIDEMKNENAESDEYESRLEEEMAIAECETEEDFLNYLINQIDDPIEYFIFNLGNDMFNDVVRKNDLINLQEVAEAVIDADGIGNTLAFYDGNEVELINDCYAYRQD